MRAGKLCYFGERHACGRFAMPCFPQGLHGCRQARCKQQARDAERFGTAIQNRSQVCPRVFTRLFGELEGLCGVDERVDARDQSDALKQGVADVALTHQASCASD